MTTPRSVLIGIDDTDAGNSIGTGALARELELYLARAVHAVSLGITRHQLLVHPDIPYTSHNSSACLEVQTLASPETLMEATQQFIAFLFHDGADPGVCITDRETFSARFLSWGRKAQDEVLRINDAVALAADEGVLLRPLGGTGGGIIGALAACSLRISRDDGRFISLAGMRSMRGTMTVAEILRATPTTKVLGPDGLPLSDGDRVETNDWVRPDLRSGQVIIRVQRDEQGYFIPKHRRREEE